MGRTTNKSLIDAVSNDITLILLNADEVIAEFGEAVASLVRKNPAVVWAKFILTDDLPNGNNMRIPKEEFSNIINSGVHMPIKMAEGSIENHENSKPLGVITHLLERDNRILALAALWHKERPSDVEYIKNRVAEKKPVDVSWEILYDEMEMSEDGVANLYGTALAAATVVKDPAYEGRTPFLAVAAKANKWSPAYINLLDDSAFLYVRDGKRYFPVLDKDGNVDENRLPIIKEEIAESSLPKKVIKSIENAINIIKNRFNDGTDLATINKEAKVIISSLEEITEEKLDELEKLTKRVEELEAKLAEAEKSLQEKTNALAEKETALSEKETKLVELEEYKASIEAEVEKVEKLNSIKQKFNEAGIEKEETYFDENADALLALDPATLDFVLQEMVSFSSKNEDENANENEEEASKKTLPNFKNLKEGEEVSVKDLAKFLKERKAK